MEQAARRAQAKLVESFPDKVRETVQQAMTQFVVENPAPPDDPRVAAFAEAVRGHRIVRINASGPDARVVHPVVMRLSDGGWFVTDAIKAEEVSLAACGDINISAHTFD
jgi:predicted DNA-binding transcriptional regulator YafY